MRSRSSRSLRPDIEPEHRGTVFISSKTASVHVSHILDKLGVSSRTEAATIAVRLGLPEVDTPHV